MIFEYQKVCDVVCKVVSVSIEGNRVPFISLFDNQKVCDVVCKVVSISIEGNRVPFILIFENQKVCDVVCYNPFAARNLAYALMAAMYLK